MYRLNTSFRYCLNIKGIPYKTVWVETPDIAPLLKRIGATYTEDGAPRYTLPTIYDPNTGATVTESAVIARYLDKTYPSTATLIPKETDALHEAFNLAFRNAIMMDLLAIGLLATYKQLSQRSAEGFRRVHEASCKVKLEELAPVGSEKRAKHWKAVEDGLHMFKGWLEADGTKKTFFTGENIAFADVTIASWLTSMKVVCGEGSEEWKDIMRWDDGHWMRFMQEFQKYQTVDVGCDLPVD